MRAVGYLVELEHVRKALARIYRYNRRDSFAGHFNNVRSYLLGDESGLLMADYPRERPKNPVPYFNEVMTGFEYAGAVGTPFRWRAAGGDGGRGAALHRGHPGAVRWARAESL